MASTSDAPRPSQRTLRDLWSKMTGIYGHAWTSKFGDSPEYDCDHISPGALNDAGKLWQAGLAGITPKQIGLGISRAVMRAGEFAPNLPEFRKLCLGIPPLAKVRLSLTKIHAEDNETAAFCRLVWQFIGDQWTFARSSPDTCARIVRDAYQLAVEYRMALGELPAAPAALISKPEPRNLTREEIAARDRAEKEAFRRGLEILGMQDPTDKPPSEVLTEESV
ncbi:MAG: hypothetical protein WA777_18455 [Rhodanobacter sp.]